MRNIVSPLSGIRSPFGGRSDLYKEAGFRPEFVADFGGEYYRANLARSTFADTLTFSRASSATMVDSTGTLVTVGVDEPRIGHHIWDGSAWVDAGYLHESEARTNLVTYSEDFTDASWVGGGCTVAADDITAPDGTDTADKATWTATTEYHSIFTTISVSGSKAYTRSVFVKYAGVRWIYIQQYDGYATPTNRGVWFDVENGTKGTEETGCTGTIQACGDGWYRCSLAFTTSAGATAERVQIAFTTGDGVSPNGLTGDGTSGVYLWGAQFEEGSTPSSYIPTNGSTATRAAETLTAPSANLPWPTPQVIGDELVTNGDFATSDDTGWTRTIDNGWDFSGGAASHTGATSGRIRQAITCVSGSVYRLQFDVDTTGDLSLSNTSVGIRNSSDSNFVNGAVILSADITLNALETYEIVFVANGTTQYVALYSEDDVSFDNVSVKEINPLALSIQMEGTMTYADTGDFEVYWYRWHDDTNNFIQVALDATSAKTGTPQFFQKESGTLDQVGGVDAYSPGINVPFNIASRHGSTFINGAVDGTALTEDTTPVALPDLSSTDLEIGYDFMGTIKTIRVWATDLGDTGIAEAST